jgi:hypothetical protein
MKERFLAELRMFELPGIFFLNLSYYSVIVINIFIVAAEEMQSAMSS